MQHIRHLCAGLLFVGFTTFAFAEDVAPTAASEIDTVLIRKQPNLLRLKN